MNLIDFILNLAGLLLWINWRSILFDPFEKRTPATLVGSLRRAVPTRFRHWHLLAAIGALLVLRAALYWQIGPGTGWTAKLDLGVTAIFFRSIYFGQMMLFSIFSFARILGIVYLWLVLLSILDGPMPTRRFVEMQLGAIDGWPRWIKFLLPFIVTGLLWVLASWPLEWLQIIPRASSSAHRVEESVVIGLGSYLAWKYPVAALLVLHLLCSYIYFGKNPFWKYVEATSVNLLQPLGKIPLRAGKADFAPVVGIALAFLIAELAGRGLAAIFSRLTQ